jgi:hypothetical protein
MFAHNSSNKKRVPKGPLFSSSIPLKHTQTKGFSTGDLEPSNSGGNLRSSAKLREPRYDDKPHTQLRDEDCNNEVRNEPHNNNDADNVRSKLLPICLPVAAAELMRI